MAYSAYIVSTDYTTTYKGIAIDSASFDRIALRASDEIDTLTMYAVRNAGIATFTAEDQERIKLATCALAEGLALQDAATDSTGIMATSEKVGSYSYSGGDTASYNKVWSDALDKAENFLLFTGLLNRTVGRWAE